MKIIGKDLFVDMKNFKNKSLLLILSLAAAGLIAHDATSADGFFSGGSASIFETAVNDAIDAGVGGKVGGYKVDSGSARPVVSTASQTSTGASSKGMEPVVVDSRSSKASAEDDERVRELRDKLLAQDKKLKELERREKALNEAEALKKLRAKPANSPEAKVETNVTLNQPAGKKGGADGLKKAKLKDGDDEDLDLEDKETDVESDDEKEKTKKNKKTMKGKSSLSKKGGKEVGDLDENEEDDSKSIGSKDLKRKNAAVKLQAVIEKLKQTRTKVEKDPKAFEKRARDMNRALTGVVRKVDKIVKEEAGADSIKDDWISAINEVGTSGSAADRLIERLDTLIGLIDSMCYEFGGESSGKSGLDEILDEVEKEGAANSTNKTDTKDGLTGSLVGSGGAGAGAGTDGTSPTETDVADPKDYVDLIATLNQSNVTKGKGWLRQIYRLAGMQTYGELLASVGGDKGAADKTFFSRCVNVQKFLKERGVTDLQISSIVWRPFINMLVTECRKYEKDHPTTFNPNSLTGFNDYENKQEVKIARTNGQKNIAKIMAVIARKETTKYTVEQLAAVFGGDLSYWFGYLNKDFNMNAAKDAIVREVAVMVSEWQADGDVPLLNEYQVDYFEGRLATVDRGMFSNFLGAVSSSIDSAVNASSNLAEVNITETQKLYESIKNKYDFIKNFMDTRATTNLKKDFVPILVFFFFDRNGAKHGAATFQGSAPNIVGAFNHSLEMAKKCIDIYPTISRANVAREVIGANLTRLLPTMQVVSFALEKIYQVVKMLSLSCNDFINGAGGYLSLITSKMKNGSFANYITGFFREAAGSRYNNVFDAMLVLFTHPMLVTHVLLCSAALVNNSNNNVFVDDGAAVTASTGNHAVAGAGYGGSAADDKKFGGNGVQAVANVLARTDLGVAHSFNGAANKLLVGGNIVPVRNAANSLAKGFTIKSHEDYYRVKPRVSSVTISEDYIDDSEGINTDTNSTNIAARTNFGVAMNTAGRVYVGSRAETGPTMSTGATFANLANWFKAAVFMFITTPENDNYGLNAKTSTDDTSKAANTAGGTMDDADRYINFTNKEGDAYVVHDFNQAASEVFDELAVERSAAGLKKDVKINTRGNINTTDSSDKSLSPMEAIDKVAGDTFKPQFDPQKVKLSPDEENKLAERGKLPYGDSNRKMFETVMNDPVKRQEFFARAGWLLPQPYMPSFRNF